MNYIDYYNAQDVTCLTKVRRSDMFDPDNKITELESGKYYKLQLGDDLDDAIDHSFVRFFQSHGREVGLRVWVIDDETFALFLLTYGELF